MGVYGSTNAATSVAGDGVELAAGGSRVCVEGRQTVELIKNLDRMRVQTIVDALREGQHVPVPREPIPRLDVEDLLIRTGLSELVERLDTRTE